MTEETGSAEARLGERLSRARLGEARLGEARLGEARLGEAGPAEAGRQAEGSTPQTGAFDTSTLGGQIAGYQIEAEIGRGGMATVYRALDVNLGRRVALKILTPRLAEDDSFRKRFIHESQAAAAVDHPNIVPVFEAGEAGGVLFIAMRYVGTGDVRTLIERHGSLPVDRATAITTQVASALDAASARGLVHRDIKPANMLLAESGDGRTDHVYLSDFGLSKHSLAPSGLTAAGQFMGTLDYVAPEQIEGRAVDGRADQYSLACAVVEMLTGEPPFRRDDNIALMWAQLSEAPPSLHERRPDLPEAIDSVVAQAMAKSPAERYPTCLDFAAALRAASVIPPPGGLRGVRTPTQPARRPPRPGSTNPLAVVPGDFGPGDFGPGDFGPGDAGRAAGPPAQFGQAMASPSVLSSPAAGPAGAAGPFSQAASGQQSMAGASDAPRTDAGDRSPANDQSAQHGPAVPSGAQSSAWGTSADQGQAAPSGAQSAAWDPDADQDQGDAQAGATGQSRAGPPVSDGQRQAGRDRLSGRDRWPDRDPGPDWGRPSEQHRQADSGRPSEQHRQADWDRPSEQHRQADWDHQADRAGQADSAADTDRTGQADPAGRADPARPAQLARHAQLARQAARWARTAETGQGASWGEAARLGPGAGPSRVGPAAGLSAAPTAGQPPTAGAPRAPSGSPLSYRPPSPRAPSPGAPSPRPPSARGPSAGAPSPSAPASASPWSASPWPASAAANPAPSEPASPAWSSPPAGPPAGRAPYSPADQSGQPVQPDLYRSARVSAPTAPRPTAGRRRRGPGKAAGLAASLIVLIVLALAGYKLVNHTSTTSTGTDSAPRPRNTVTRTVLPLTRPGAVVRAYFAAIDQHRYHVAWRLGGRNTHLTYARFVAGFVGTAHDSVRILAQNGDTATAKVVARQADGTRKLYRGTYTVVRGSIVSSNVKPVG